ncbi:S8 family serine peptidase [Sinomicrobium pectinilyticum]|nr:S8 family serine peptidase [Sinomicrobium pectinilyticum]
MKYRILILSFIVCSFFQCESPNDKFQLIEKVFDTYGTIPDSLIKKEDWYYKDILDDSIPGISLEKAEKTILKNRKGREVIVAVIDGRFDINHPAIKDYIWENPSENLNYRDDDGNGYIDDMYGWNFMGNNNGDNASTVNQEYVRIVRLYKEHFKNKTLADISQEEVGKFNLYIKAKEKLEDELKKEEDKLVRLNDYYNTYITAREALKFWFPDYNYNLETLNQIDTINNPELAPHVKEIKEVIEWGETDEFNIHYNKKQNDRVHKVLNIDFNDRELVGDNPYDINDTIYGNNQVFAQANIFDHGTRVSSVITGVFRNYSENLKILPISKSPTGDYYDKDLALAIRYAVNKGAKVINMSFIKLFSLNNQWVLDAMKYAEAHNVLIVSAAGNLSTNVDDEIQYPLDKDSIGHEIVDNFLKVGGSSYTVNENLRAYFSSYGANDVDLFAPGYEIETAFPNHNTYGFPLYHTDSGTSLSTALVSGVAALIFSNYPDLTATEVKYILMDSGIAYTFPVKVPTKEDKNHKIPFDKLSKSGKIVNAYNALLMAERVSKE